MTDEELRLVRFWLETGAPYAGTYAANGTGLSGWYYMNIIKHNDEEWPETVDASYFFGNDPIEVEGELLDPHALHLNPVYYADKSIIDRCALMHDAGDAQEMLLEMWNEIKLAR